MHRSHGTVRFGAWVTCMDGSVRSGCGLRPAQTLHLVKESEMRTGGPSKRKWVVVKIMALFRVLSTIRHLVFRGPKRGP